MNKTQFEQYLAHYRDRVEAALMRYLPQPVDEPARLSEAMQYALLVGGKRVRPLLVYAAGTCMGTDEELLDPIASAVECIHAYSLVHDDMPVMDDDELRRGQPTCHIKYDEATAMLVGDALQTLAFDILAHHVDNSINSEQKLRMVGELARASGHVGMVGGQAIDLYSVGKALDIKALENMHGKKTGALIQASVTLGALSNPATTTEQISALQRYAHCIGLAFQVTDDILDVEGETAVIGKTQGADLALNKPTYPALLGMEEAKQTAQSLHQQALDALSLFDEKADLLRTLSAYIVQRNH